MFLFAGLGNPGPKYAGNRHNIGFMAVDAIVRRHRFSPWRRRFQGAACEGEIAGEKVLALLPETFMNDSGRAVAEAQRFYKIDLKDIFVFHDELDLPPAKVRVKHGGGNAGHNGLRSVTAHCGNDYGRRAARHRPSRRQGAGDALCARTTSPRPSAPGWRRVCDGCAELAELLVKGRPDEFQSRMHLLLDARGIGANGKPAT